MDILLDTHIFLWLMNGENTLKVSTRQIIDETCKNNTILISAISVWEIGMLINKNRISLNQPIYQWIEQAISFPFIKIHPLTSAIALESCQLPHQFHGDPADRIIVATARVLNIPLITRDNKIIEYASGAHLTVIEA